MRKLAGVILLLMAGLARAEPPVFLMFDPGEVVRVSWGVVSFEKKSRGPQRLFFLSKEAERLQRPPMEIAKLTKGPIFFSTTPFDAPGMPPGVETVILLDPTNLIIFTDSEFYYGTVINDVVHLRCGRLVQLEAS